MAINKPTAKYEINVSFERVQVKEKSLGLTTVIIWRVVDILSIECRSHRLKIVD